MQLYGSTRSMIATITAVVIFVLTYLCLFNGWIGAPKVLWLSALAAALLSALAYIGVTLCIDRIKEADEIEVDQGVTQADVNAAVQHCLKSAARLDEIARSKQLDPTVANAFRELATLTRAIADNFKEDPEDLRLGRKLLGSFLPRLLTVSESYVGLAMRATGRDARRLETIREEIFKFVGHFENFKTACLVNDFSRLEIEAKQLSAGLDVTVPKDDGGL